MKKLTVVLVAVVLSGCYRSVDSWSLNQANKYCAEHDGISNLFVMDIGHDKVVCNDGFQFELIRKRESVK